MNVEDSRRVYEAKDAFLWLPTSFGKSVHYKVLSFACLTVNKASWVQGGGSYTVMLLVSPLGSLTIANFYGLSVHYFVVAYFQLCMYTTFEYLVRILLHMDNLRKCYNYSGNGRACTSSRYQAISLLPSGLGTRL